MFMNDAEVFIVDRIDEIGNNLDQAFIRAPKPKWY